ncbi:MAG TPA: deoxynucleoside kinase [Solirubrobacteraceae bacterium]|nr:deoxynucleoside kinase [Solirubrobacteraceae bacterium]
METSSRILVVAGSIATGKTELVGALSSVLGVPPFRERWEENPWFDAHPRDAFFSQMWFLLAAGADHARMSFAGGVQERCIHEHARVFARELLVGDDLRLLGDVYARLDARLPDPALLVHLTASPGELMRRIRLRERMQERDLTVEYLQSLQWRYSELVDGWTRCPVVEVDTEAIDIRTSGGVRHVVARTTEKLA